MYLTYIVLLICFSTVNSELRYEGFSYYIEFPEGNYYPRFPQEVENDVRSVQQITKWFQDPKELYKCGCPASEKYRKMIFAQGETDKNILFQGDRQPCTCFKKVQHSVIKTEYCGEFYDSYDFGFKIYFAENELHIVRNSNEEKTSAFSLKFVFLVAIKACIHKTLDNVIVKSHLSPLVPMKKPGINLSRFKKAFFDKIQKVDQFYDKENQFRHFRTIMDPDIVDNLEKTNFHLVPRQIAREENMILNNVKPTTLYNFNLTSIWNNIADSWAKIQNEILQKYLKEIANESFIKAFFSGTYGHYKCEKDSVDSPLYLEIHGDGNRIKVPYYHWNLYILQVKERTSNVFVIMHNDYYPRKENPQQEKLCKESVCDEFAIFGKNIENKRNILAYCCLADKNNWQIVQKLQLEHLFDEDFQYNMNME